MGQCKYHTSAHTVTIAAKLAAKSVSFTHKFQICRFAAPSEAYNVCSFGLQADMRQ